MDAPLCTRSYANHHIQLCSDSHGSYHAGTQGQVEQADLEQEISAQEGSLKMARAMRIKW